MPNGMRVYAIGDVHGRLDLLHELLEKIAADDARRGNAESHLIMLGDLVNRGPDSAGVVALVQSLNAAETTVQLIKGNHEEIFIEAARGSGRAARALLGIGGLPTLLSYGITEREAKLGTFQNLADLMIERVPSTDVDFLDAGEDLIQFGDYVFVHAGIRPGIPFEQQCSNDMRWIRGDFLNSREDHSAVIVHGHTIFDTVDEQFNRIGIDTGAFATGNLSAIAIEGDERWFLSTAI